MNIAALQSLVTGAIAAEAGPRRPHKFWVPYAWAVRALVEEEGMNISEATRVVLTNSTEAVTPQNMNCLRVVYYKIKERQWPWDVQRRVREFCGLKEEAEVVIPEPEVVIPEPEEVIPEPVVIDPTEEADEGYIPDREEFEV